MASQPGDLLLAVASADEPAVVDAMRRAPAWGASTLWIGSGPRPPAGAANHILWMDSDDPMVPATGRFVLMYHLLWELTHVCFEHPGLLKPRDDECTEDVCVTCSDEGRLGEVVLAPADATGQALVRTADGEEFVDITLLGDVAPNDLVLVHAGAAITRLDEVNPMTDSRIRCHQLPVPLHRIRGDRRQEPAGRPRRLGARQGRGERSPATGIAR